jgi:CRP-like cAMP-binding protein
MNSALKLLERLVPSQRYGAGEVIFQAGEFGYQMFVVSSGEVDLLNGDEHVETLTAGGTFGEQALLDPAPRSLTAVARTECVVLLVNARAFRLLVEHSPEAAIQMMARANHFRHLGKTQAEDTPPKIS